MSDFFKVKGIDFDISNKDVWINYHNREILLYIELGFETESKKIPYELQMGRLYHHNGFNTHIKDPKQLVGAKFVWTDCENQEGTEAGYFAMVEHESVTSGTIEILDITQNTIHIKWTGTANIYWNKKFGEDVPFETEFTAQIDTSSATHIICPLKSTKMDLDPDTSIELTNFPEFVEGALSVVEKDRNWNNVTLPLRLNLIHKGIVYQGYVDMAQGNREKQKLYFDTNCPVSIEYENLCFNLKCDYMEIAFSIK